MNYTDAKTSREYEEYILGLVTRVRTTPLTSPGSLLAGTELLRGSVYNLSLMHGGSHEDQVNRAALSLLRGKSAFLEALITVRDADERCDARVAQKLMALILIACSYDEEMTNFLKDPEPREDQSGRNREFDDIEESPDSEASIFLLGSSYRITEEGEDTNDLRREAWRLSEGKPRLRGWYWVFFLEAPLPVDVAKVG